MIMNQKCNFIIATILFGINIVPDIVIAIAIVIVIVMIYHLSFFFLKMTLCSFIFMKMHKNRKELKTNWGHMLVFVYIQYVLYTKLNTIKNRELETKFKSENWNEMKWKRKRKLYWNFIKTNMQHQ